MKIVSVFFPDRGGHGDYKRLCDAFEYSVVTNCSNATLEIIEGDTPEEPRGLRQSYRDNTYKLDQWLDAVERSDEEIILIDCDTLVLADPFEAFKSNPDFDIAYTVRKGHKYWLNGGVIFVRPTDAGKNFMRAWVRSNAELVADSRKLEQATNRHCGINQAALVRLLDNPPKCRLAELPCAIWNNVDQTWGDVSDETRVLHIKGLLRELVLSGAPEHRVPYEYRTAWRIACDYDRKAREAAV